MNAGSIEVALRFIGVVRTPFREQEGTPIQPKYAEGAPGEVVVEEPFEEALDDIEGMERIWIVTLLDRAAGFRPKVVPYLDDQAHGIFATRSPCRPNPIGLSVVRLCGREGRVLRVLDVDVLDGTPLLDIKPYVPAFDAHPGAKAGWYDRAKGSRRRADNRFGKG